MDEFQRIMAEFELHCKTEKNILRLSLGLLVGISLFVSLDVVRIDPFLFYLLGMLTMIVVVIKTRRVSSNYDRLCKFLKINRPELSGNKKLLFYMDYQLNKAYKKNPKELKKSLSCKNHNEKFMRKIAEIEFLYESLSEDLSMETLEF
ncbi:hypothetical protein [Vagococcus acidifermentans]|uniref:Uncharacterized protein n=1 Tax=Vagococcus acidifermentans TaxID=564710 RepID=A0A430B0K4_9ENTE|nr:hypothetical protein [Vagococcus acidifermentans]RSU13855.1 hypothetical protein CBF27_02845 [Vagococcus acidifermentans]